jgi:hypothetical protein
MRNLPAVPVTLSTSRREEPSGVLTIDCAECAYQHTPTCDDCVVTFLVDREPDDALVVDAQEARAVRLLERAGLVPGIRHTRQVS